MQIFECHIVVRAVLCWMVMLCSVVTQVQHVGFAQQSQRGFEHLSLEQGLPQNTVNCILQDSKGFLWLGTQDGLCRYDGYTFLTYRHDPRNATSISDSFIHALYEDKHGTLWIGTHDGGLNAFDRATGRFTHYRHSAKNRKTIPNNVITAICPHDNGQLWIGTRGGTCLFDPSTGSVNVLLMRGNGNSKLSGDEQYLPENAVNALLRDRRGVLWIGSNKGLSCYNPTSRTLEPFALQEPATNVVHNFADKEIYSLLEDYQGLLWVGTSEGLYAINIAQHAVVHFVHQPSASNSLPGNRVRAMVEDHTKTLWVCIDGKGVCAFDRLSGTFTTYGTDASNPRSLSHNSLLSLYCDRQGILWVGTNGGGLNKMSGAGAFFALYRVSAAAMPQRANVQHSTGLHDNNIDAFYEDRQGMMWIGTDNGLHLWNRQTGVFTLYLSTGSGIHTLPNNNIKSILQDRQGMMWIGTAAGLAWFNPVTNTFTNFRNHARAPSALKTANIAALLEDKNGIVWIATRGGGLIAYSPKTSTFQEFLAVSSGKGLSNNDVISLYQDHAGNLWAGTVGGGACRFNPSTGAWNVFHANTKDSAALSSNSVYGFYEDTEHRLWIGTTGGLNCLNAERTSCAVFREQHGLPNDVVYDILPDKQGNLWLTTNKGLARFSPTLWQCTNYTVSDGLQSDEFNKGAGLVSRNGMIYVGGVQGFNEFMPERIRTNAYVPPVVLTDFKKFNRSFSLDTVVTYTTQIDLDYTDNFFSFEFAALNFVLPEKNRYKFKLEGFNNDWIDAGTKREATYTNLEPKTYIFRVKASNNDGVWNEDGASVRIVIRPPWWKTWWFRTLGLIALVTTGVSWYRLRVYQVQKRNELLERLVEERTSQLRDSNEEVRRNVEEIQRQNRQLIDLNNEKNELMGIVAHDLKNPLSNIKMLAALLRQESSKLSPGEIEEFSTDILDASERMFDLITNLLNVNAIEQGGVKLHPSTFDLQALVRDIMHYYVQAALTKHIELHYENHIAPNNGEVAVFADRNAALQIIDNLVSNAVKYSPHGKRVIVRLVKGSEPHLIRVEIEDQGPGLSESDKKKLFGKYTRLSAQPTGGESSTGLGLSIVKKLAEAMGGRVWCESELGKGATFIVELPCREIQECSLL
jgi:ligand-binding sensor domain-containing protein/signal transduction histidine kinase